MHLSSKLSHISRMTLAEASARRRQRKRKVKPPRVSANCMKGQCTACHMKNCVCSCGHGWK